MLSIVNIYSHLTTETPHQHSSLSTLNTELLQCGRQFQTRPLAVAPKFDASRSKPQTAGDLNISNYTILNIIRQMRLLAARPDALNPLSVVNSTQTNIQSKTWTPFPISHT
jgi:hypothetical protein